MDVKHPIMAAIFIQIFFWLLTGWAFMMAVGVVHHEWISACPTIGFFWACLIAFFIRLALFLDSLGD